MGEEAITGLTLALSRAERRVSRRLADVVTTHGTTVDEWRILAVLVDGPGRPMRELAEAAAVPGPTLTKIVDGMVATDLVDRHPDAGDRRRVLVSLRPRGRSLHRTLSPLIEAECAALEERVGVTEIDELTRRLEGLLDRIDP